MGCFPNQGNKNCFGMNGVNKNNKQALHEEDTTHLKDEKIDKQEKIKVNGGLFLREEKGDPYALYTTTQILGEGSFGQVFKVEHKITKAVRAMKIINKLKVCNSDENEDDLINEINVLKKLDHPNILKLFEFYNTSRKLFIISELCTGGELFDRITEVKYFNEKIAAHIMRQLFSAISFCHHNNVIHRDLKPENILIDSEQEKKKEYFNIKIIDFGTSEVFKKNKLLDKQIGTPFYIAPEVLNNEYNEKCDLWSAGVIMFILLSGTPPFYGNSDEEIYNKVKEGKFCLKSSEWDDISSDAKELIKNLLVKDYNKRYSADQALNHKWIKTMKENSNKPLSKEHLSKVAINFQDFNCNQKLQQATLAYIVHNLTKKEDLDEVRRAFNEFDENGDGKLSRDELIKGLSKVMTPTEAKEEVNRIMKMIDGDNNGFIEYEEFMQATLSKDKMINDENLQTVFNLFDKDGSGKISPSEIKEILGGDSDISDNVWGDIMKEIDANGDGEIEFDEFKQMMNLILTNKSPSG